MLHELCMYVDFIMCLLNQWLLKFLESTLRGHWVTLLIVNDFYLRRYV